MNNEFDKVDINKIITRVRENVLRDETVDTLSEQLKNCVKLFAKPLYNELLTEYTVNIITQTIMQTASVIFDNLENDNEEQIVN
jgi:hypothetical protein